MDNRKFSSERLKGWAVDLKAVYAGRWREDRAPCLDLFESPDGNTACLLYDIAEIGVGKEIGRLAVFRNKADPELLYNFAKLKCWYLYNSAAQFGVDGYIFVHRYKTALKFDRAQLFREKLTVTVCVLDLAAGRYALLDHLPENLLTLTSAVLTGIP